MNIRSIVILILVLMTMACIAIAADKPVKFSELPKAVQDAMLKEATGATIKNTVVEIEGGKTFYECETVLNGKTRDFLVDTSGKVTEVEEQIEINEAPAPIRATMQKALSGGGKLIKLESIKKDGKVVGYEASVVEKNGKKTGIEINADGALKK